MEKWDLYDENRELINKIYNREDIINIGEYHIVIDIWTVNDK